MGQLDSQPQARDVDADALPAMLVVDDVPLVRLLVAGYLRECGMRVIEAANADEAIRVLETDVLVDVVFADVNMPGRHDGFGLARWVRDNRPGTGVVLGSGVAETAEKAKALGHEGPIVAKPYNLPELERRLRALIN
jgi:CheY-like chemotaxis protein